MPINNPTRYDKHFKKSFVFLHQNGEPSPSSHPVNGENNTPPLKWITAMSSLQSRRMRCRPFFTHFRETSISGIRLSGNKLQLTVKFLPASF